MLVYKKFSNMQYILIHENVRSDQMVDKQANSNMTFNSKWLRHEHTEKKKFGTHYAQHSVQSVAKYGTGANCSTSLRPIELPTSLSSQLSQVNVNSSSDKD